MCIVSRPAPQDYQTCTRIIIHNTRWYIIYLAQKGYFIEIEKWMHMVLIASFFPTLI